MAEVVPTSILTSIKKLFGPGEDDTTFDIDIIIHINTALFNLNQIGVGPSDGFFITDKSQTWSDFIGTNRKDIEAVKTYVYLKVKLVFDPPQSGVLVDAIKQQISELEWRLNNQVGKEVI